MCGRLVCFSFHFSIFILAVAAVASLLPFLYFAIFLAILAIDFLCALTFIASFPAFFFSFLAYFITCLPPFFTTFFTTRTRLACFSFHFSIFIFTIAAPYSLLPFLYFAIFLAILAIDFLCALTFIASFPAFFFSFLAYFIARLPPLFTTFFTTFVTMCGRLVCFSFHFSIFILTVAAVASLLPFLYFAI